MSDPRYSETNPSISPTPQSPLSTPVIKQFLLREVVKIKKGKK